MALVESHPLNQCTNRMNYLNLGGAAAKLRMKISSFSLFQLVALLEEQAYLAKHEGSLTLKYHHPELQWLGNPFETSPMQSAQLQHQQFSFISSLLLLKADHLFPCIPIHLSFLN